MKREEVLFVINNVPVDLMCDLFAWLKDDWMPENRPGTKGFVRNVPTGYEFFITEEELDPKKVVDKLPD